MKTAVYSSLRLAHELLGTPLPRGLIADLRPPTSKVKAIKLLLRLAGLFDPDSPKFSRPEYLFLNALLFDDLPTFTQAVLPRELSLKDGKPSTGLALAHLRRWRNLVWQRGRSHV